MIRRNPYCRNNYYYNNNNNNNNGSNTASSWMIVGILLLLFELVLVVSVSNSAADTSRSSSNMHHPKRPVVVITGTTSTAERLSNKNKFLSLSLLLPLQKTTTSFISLRIIKDPNRIQNDDEHDPASANDANTDDANTIIYHKKYHPSNGSEGRNIIIQQTIQQQQQLSNIAQVVRLVPSNKRNLSLLSQPIRQHHSLPFAAIASSLSSSLLLSIPRGGGTSTITTTGSSIGIVASLINPRPYLLQFINYVGTSRTRCLVLLLSSIICENISITLSKRAKDIGSVKLFICSIVLNLFCLFGFNISLSKIEVSVAYAIWSAVGTMIVSAIGIFVFHESCSFIKLVCLSLIALGVLGLNLLT